MARGRLHPSHHLLYAFLVGAALTALGFLLALLEGAARSPAVDGARRTTDPPVAPAPAPAAHGTVPAEPAAATKPPAAHDAPRPRP